MATSVRRLWEAGFQNVACIAGLNGLNGVNGAGKGKEVRGGGAKGKERGGAEGSRRTSFNE
jgi:hypothetical protein